jgi:hypothetical protein
LHTLADDAGALLDALDVDVTSVAGIDLGAPVAWMLAQRHPGRVRRLAVMEALVGRLPGAEGFLAAGPPWWFGLHAVPGLPESIIEARGRGIWPIRIPLKPPTSAERSTDPVACHAWAKLWDHYTGTGTIERSTLRFPNGLHAMPKTLVLDSPLAAASVHPSTRETWIRCGERLTRLQRVFPKARFDRVIRRLTEMDADDFQRQVATVSWLDAHPTSGLMLRQLPIEGVGTKWLGKNKSLLLALLGAEDDLADEAANETDGPASARMRLHERLGFRAPPDLIQIAVLDPEMRSMVGGLRHFAASVEDLNASGLRPRTVVILENKETGYAITGDLAGTVVCHGAGFSIVNYARVNWIRNAPQVVYWGDIDAPGLCTWP